MGGGSSEHRSEEGRHNSVKEGMKELLPEEKACKACHADYKQTGPLAGESVKRVVQNET